MDYQIEKHMMISLVAVAVSLTVGLLLVNFAHGQEYTTIELCITGYVLSDTYDTYLISIEGEAQCQPIIDKLKSHNFTIAEPPEGSPIIVPENDPSANDILMKKPVSEVPPVVRANINSIQDFIDRFLR